jgi:phosphohistidine phosphatase SixA
MHKHMMRIWLLSLLGLFNLQMAQAEELTGDTLVTALKQGNWVLVMRHTSSPRELPTALNKAVNNDKGERQLDAKGRDDAAAFGEALRRLNVTVDEVKSSPAFRARQTAMLAGFAEVEQYEELGNDSMQQSGADQVTALHALLSAPPAEGNRLVITHGPNLQAAFPEEATGLEEGDGLLLVRIEPGVAQPLGTVRIGTWAALQP